MRFNLFKDNIKHQLCHFEGGTTEKSPKRENLSSGDFSLRSK